MGPLVFKTSVGREERPGCVRFAHVSASVNSAAPHGVAAVATAAQPCAEQLASGPERDTMRVRYLMIVPVLAAALLGSGCTSVKATLDKKFTPPPTIVTQEATVAAPSAQVSGTVSAGFPETLPLWPGSELVKKKTTRTPQGKSYTASFQTTDPYADVLAGVGQGLKTAHFKVAVTDGSTGVVKVSILMISNSKVEGIVTISQIPHKPVSIEYVITPKKKK